MAVMEAAQLNRYHAAYPHVLAMLGQMSNDDCKKMLEEKSAGPANDIRIRALQKMMEPFLPPSYKQHGDKVVYSQGKPIPKLSIRAAKGLVQAAKVGYLSDNDIWLTIYRDYPAIAATAVKDTN